MLTDICPLGPTVLDPLNPPAPIVVCMPVPELLPELLAELLPDPLAPELFWAVLPAFSVRHGLSLLTTIVVPPLLPVTIETFAPPPEVLVTLSANALAAIKEPAAKTRVVVKTRRMWLSVELLPVELLLA